VLPYRDYRQAQAVLALEPRSTSSTLPASRTAGSPSTGRCRSRPTSR